MYRPAKSVYSIEKAQKTYASKGQVNQMQAMNERFGEGEKKIMDRKSIPKMNGKNKNKSTDFSS